MTSAPETRTTPRVVVAFDRPDRRYEPGQPLDVRYEIDGLGGERPTAIEQSVLWYTEGKGEEDLGVHFFNRITAREALEPAAAAGSFATVLPASPLSYEGLIVKIRWCVRIRIFFAGGRDFVSEHTFDVGDIPAVRMAVDSPA